MSRRPKFIPLPDAAARAMQTAIVGSVKQMKRVAAGGSLEADPTEHNARITDEDRRRADARRKIEDRKMLKEMEWD